jgi:hypothetical protein
MTRPAPRFERRVVVVAPGEAHAYDPAEWRDALVVIERGELEVETTTGRRHRFESGATIWLTGLPLKALVNSGQEPAVLVALSRRSPR